MSRQIIGAKGGAGGASFVTKPDSLRSNDSFEILLGLGSGRWKGLVDGLKGLKINGVPMENADGTANFENVVAVFADGNPLEQQLVNFKLGGGGATQQVGTALANPNTGTPGPWVSGAVATQNADFIDLRFVVQQLYYQDKKSIRENTANIEIQMRPSNSATWINIFAAPVSNTLTYDESGFENLVDNGSVTRLYLGRSLFNTNGTGFKASVSPNLAITGKTNSAFVKELRIGVPKLGTYANVGWEVRARLIEKDTIDNGDIQERRAVAFESITAIIKQPLGTDPAWDGQVWMQLYGKASDQFNGFPNVEGVFDTKICKVPPLSVFNPDTRAYTLTTWDGSYVESFTMDPAWQIKEFVEDPIHGLAGLQPGSTVDKWDALEASKYYSELVPDGKGGTHPRFSMHLTINEAQNVNELMSFLAGAVNSYTEDVGDGKWRLKVDKPETPKAVFTEDNIFGQFNYSHTDVDTRFNDWRGTFLNEDFDYQQDTARIFDQPNIDENGTRFTEIALVGCTNRQEALRRLMFRLRVALNEYKVVRFSTNRFGRYLSPLDTILVADGALNADYLVKSTSRVNSIATNVVTLKRPMRLEVGVNYVLKLTKTDLTTLSLTVTNTAGQRGDVSTIYVSGNVPAGVMTDSAVALEAVGLSANPVSYRVISVERDEQDEDLYSISASIIDSGKWNAMDNVSEQAITAQTTFVEIDAPTVPAGGMFSILSYATDFEIKRVMQVNWDRPGSLFLEGFKVEYRINDGAWKILSENLKDSVVELESPQDGLYDFKITAMDRRGVQSSPLIGTYDLLGTRESIAPTHVRGPLGARPLVGPYEGYRYTALNASSIPTTFVWEGGVWVNESNLITQGNQIGVSNGATVGATLGTNLYDSGGAVQGDTAVKNTAISIGVGGNLVGGGGGQVTIGGLGFAGDLNATVSDNLFANSLMPNSAFGWYENGLTRALLTGGPPTPYGFTAPARAQLDYFGQSNSVTGLAQGKRYYLGFFYRADGTGTVPEFTPSADFLDSLGNYLSSASNLSFGGYTANTWNYAEVSFVMPAGATKANIGIYAQSHVNHAIQIAIPRLAPTPIGATVGATWGTDVSSRPTNLAGLTGGEGINNALVSVAANGSLSGAGGGQVTIGGLGFTGDTDAQRNSRITIASGLITGIGTGVNTPVANSLINISGNNLNGIGTGSGTAVVNAGISVAANGTLSGAGGGQVTIGGLGFTGDLGAERNNRINVQTDASGAGGRGRIRFLNNNVELSVFQASSVFQNLDIGIASGLISGIGTGNNTAVGNSLVTVGANGTLSGAGGGQVTIGGLGYIGDLAATNDLSLVATVNPGSIILKGNGARQTGVTGSYSYCVTATSSIVGPCYVETDIKVGNVWSMIAMDTDYGQYDYASHSVTLHFNESTGAWNIYVNGTPSGSGTQGAGYRGKLILLFDGAKVHAYSSGVFLGSVTAPSPMLTGRIFANWNLYNINVDYSGFAFGHAAERNWQNFQNRPSNLVALTGSEGINNAAVSVGANGVLSGAGGGQVTIGGLGFGGDLVATSSDNMVVNSTLGFGTGGWGSSANLARIVGVVPDPGNYWQANGANGYAYINATDSGIKPIPSGAQKLFVSGKVLSNNGTGYYQIIVAFYDGSYNFITQSIANLFAGTANQWTDGRAEMTVPNGAVFHQSYIQSQINSGTFVNLANLRIAPTEAASTLGATWNTNLSGRPTNVAALGGTEGINNTLVSVAANGALSGAGGGQVTIGGLGFLGDLSASIGDNSIINPGFTGASTRGWSLSNTVLAGPDSNWPGQYAARCDPSTTGSAQQINKIPWHAQDTYINAWVYHQGTPTYSDLCGECSNANGTVIGYIVMPVASTPGYAWARVGGLIPKSSFPAGTTSQIRWYWQSSNPAGVTTWMTQFRASTTQEGSTLGAAWAGNVTGRPGNLSGLSGSEGINNTLVTVAANGALAGAGGGQVTSAGLNGVSAPTGNGILNNSLYLTNGKLGTPNWGFIFNDILANSYVGINGVNLTNDGGLSLLGAVANSGVSVAANGALSGAGGGQVTITGLGYLGDLNATKDLSLNSSGPANYKVAGNNISKISGANDFNTAANGYNQGYIFTAGSLTGGCRVSGFTNYGSEVWVGLISGNSGEPGAMAYAFRTNTNLTLDALTGATVSGPSVGSNVDGGTQLELVYDNVDVMLKKDGGVVFTWPNVGPNLNLRPQFFIKTVGGVFNNVIFETFTDNNWNSFGGIGLPESNATFGANLIYNGNAEMGSTDGWEYVNMDGGNAQSMVVDTSARSAGKWGFIIVKSDVGQATQRTGKAIPVVPGKKYIVRVNLNGSTPTANGLYIRMNQKGSPPNDGFRVGADRSGYTDLADNAAIPSAATTFQYVYTPPAGVYFVSPSIYNWTNGPVQMRWDDFTMEESAWGPNAPEDKADVSVQFLNAVDQKVQATSAGVPKSGQLARVVNLKMMRNGLDVTAATTWSVVILSGTATASIGANTGALTINASGGVFTTTRVRVSTANGGYTREFELLFTREDDPPTAGSSAGGGTSANGGLSGSVNTTVAPYIVISPELSMTVGSNGTTTLTTPQGSFTADASTAPTGSFEMRFRWQWWNGSAWADIGTEVVSSSPCVVEYEAEFAFYYVLSDGTMSVSLTHSGLTAGSAQKYRLTARVSTGRALFPAGSGSAVGT